VRVVADKRRQSLVAMSAACWGASHMPRRSMSSFTSTRGNDAAEDFFSPLMLSELTNAMACARAAKRENNAPKPTALQPAEMCPHSCPERFNRPAERPARCERGLHPRCTPGHAQRVQFHKLPRIVFIILRLLLLMVTCLLANRVHRPACGRVAVGARSLHRKFPRTCFPDDFASSAA